MEEQEKVFRKLASIVRVDKIEPIDGADFIVLATVKGWKVVVKKDEYKEGDFAIYCEIDSFLPIRDEYSFLERSYKKLVDGSEGYRLKTAKLRGVYSQGLLLPISLLVDMDVTDFMGITKYEASIPAQLSGTARGSFPSFIRKTDEERIQNLTKFTPKYRTLNFYITEKLDGTSFTAYNHDGVFGVCSRNLDLKETGGNTYWEVARTLDLENKMNEIYPERSLAIQGEIIGEGIQGNKYHLMGSKLFAFNIYDIKEGRYVTKEEFESMCDVLGIDKVPVIDKEATFPESIDAALLFAEGKSALNQKTEREGLVWVADTSGGERVSFKTISNKFLAKNED